MNESRPFTNQNFKLTDLAEGVELSTNHVSQVLNKELGQNFHEFVNQHRYEAARVLMTSTEYEHYSLQGIAEEVGFNSKSAFYRNFKRLSGKTPSEFVQEVKKSAPIPR
jgi:AraC-like DNA-binding protein